MAWPPGSPPPNGLEDLAPSRAATGPRPGHTKSSGPGPPEDPVPCPPDPLPRPGWSRPAMIGTSSRAGEPGSCAGVRSIGGSDCATRPELAPRGGGLERDVQRNGSVPRRQVIEIRNVHLKTLFDELIAKGHSERFEAGASEVVRPDAVGPDQKHDVGNRRRSIGCFRGERATCSSSRAMALTNALERG